MKRIVLHQRRYRLDQVILLNRTNAVADAIVETAERGNVGAWFCIGDIGTGYRHGLPSLCRNRHFSTFASPEELVEVKTELLALPYFEMNITLLPSIMVQTEVNVIGGRGCVREGDFVGTLVVNDGSGLRLGARIGNGGFQDLDTEGFPSDGSGKVHDGMPVESDASGNRDIFKVEILLLEPV